MSWASFPGAGQRVPSEGAVPIICLMGNRCPGLACSWRRPRAPRHLRLVSSATTFLRAHAGLLSGRLFQRRRKLERAEADMDCMA